ncbi:hypothetical protein LOY46_06330 [Pseudomonas sichuanensis]|uniref:hypothetical protein n=1 Tax=Pseudomonas sichuanensis TaxID=2213015 RepID=UPI002160D445|nr:hypothetical protein [Pseudomonas sichuanensis]UVK84313.1 hypothetical protein LOY46_06330 [Pseudomonas sichuanensis]
MVFQFYIDKLDGFNKFLYIVRVCKAILPKLSDHSSDNYYKSVHSKYATSLRMLGRNVESIAEFDKLLLEKNDSSTIASIHVSCGYSNLTLVDYPQARECAKKAKATKVKGAWAYHADSIEILASEAEGRFGKLKKLASKARKDKCYISANNMEFDLIEQCNDESQKLDQYRKLWKQAKQDHDTYNMLRSIANCCDIAMNLGLDISEEETHLLLEAYKFSYGQRQNGMFTRCHKALWQFFERHDSLENLLILYRHSSILQRLTGKDTREKDYLARLIKKILEVGSDLTAVDESVKRYFIARALSHNLMSNQHISKLLGV